MTDEQKMRRVRTLLQNDPLATDDDVMEYLEMAKDEILNYLYWGEYEEGTEVPTKYHVYQCEIAANLFARRGGLGEVLHIENGIHRDWYSSDMREIFAKMTPFAKVV